MKKIVVGVDESPGAATALRWALTLAEETGAQLEVVNAWQLSYGWVDGYWPDVERWMKEAQIAAERRVDDMVSAATQGNTARVKVDRCVMEGAAAAVLIEQARGADLLVVGCRGHGGFAGLLLGSVSQQCVEHAEVPVVVVPEPQ